jgi:predicted MFS family arabinose efflux permease
MPRDRHGQADGTFFLSPDFCRFLFGRLVSGTGSVVAPIAMTFALLRQHMPVTDIGVAFMSQGIAMALFVLIGGVVADRFSRRTVMICTDLIRMVIQAWFSYELLTGRPSFTMFVVALALMGSAQAFSMPAVSGLITALLPPGDLQRGNSLRAFASFSATVAGPALAGTLIATVGPAWALGFDALSYGIDAAVMASLRPPLGKMPGRRSYLGDIAAGWQEFRRHRWLLPQTAQSAAWHLLVFAPFTVVGATVMQQRFESRGSVAWGLVLAAEGVGAVIGALIWRWRTTRRPLRLANLALAFYAVPVVLIAAHAPLLVVLLSALPAGLGDATFDTLYDTSVQSSVRGDYLSRVSSFRSLTVACAIPVGYGLVAVLTPVLGLAGMLWLAGLVGLAPAGCAFGLRAIRTQTLSPAAAVEAV